VQNVKEINSKFSILLWNAAIYSRHVMNRSVSVREVQPKGDVWMVTQQCDGCICVGHMAQ